MKPAGKPKKVAKKSPESSRLTREDWLGAAFRAVVDGGFDNVRVLSIADSLGVTRGSFYWHFTDHAALVDALLEAWRARERESEQRLQMQASPDPETDLELLLDAALAHAGADLENMRFELALRGLGRRDVAVAQMLQDVDQARLALFETKFQRLTGNAIKAAELASLFYMAVVGSHQALSRPLNPDGAKETYRGIIASYLIHQHATDGPARGS